jgi:hypothetical protein
VAISKNKGIILIMTDERLRRAINDLDPSKINQEGGTPIGSSEQFEEAITRLDEQGKDAVAIFGPDGITVTELPDEVKDALARIREEIQKRQNSQGN